MLHETAYLMGGRGRLPVDIYHPRNGTWTVGTEPPMELHHMQCVPVPQEHRIYIVSSWTGDYPMEQNTEFIKS
jgi:hypothetical protein